MSLFERSADAPVPPSAPLAERMRPRTLDEYAGQLHVVGEGRKLRAAVEHGNTGSLILCGPPGVGKTTLAGLIAAASELYFEPFSAVLSGVKDVRAAVAEARTRRQREGRGTMLFVDEIHRFNKAQQDAFLPHVEKGDIVLIGATTENPSFSVISALLSRCRVVVLEPLDDDAILGLVDRALHDAERGLGARQLQLTDDARTALIHLSAGDARRALNGLEAAAEALAAGSRIEAATVHEAFQQRALRHDRAGDHHYDLLSALHKSLRNSDAQASVYWLARLLEAGADPLQPARRMLAMAAEDIGLADPMALQIAVAAFDATHRLGLPEARLPLTQAAVYLAAAPKSNRVLRAIDSAARAVREGAQHPVPLHLRNAPTRLQQQQGHGDGYRYAHDTDAGVAAMQCLPEALAGSTFYQPGDRGFEQRMRERLDDADQLRRSEAPPAE